MLKVWPRLVTIKDYINNSLISLFFTIILHFLISFPLDSTLFIEGLSFNPLVQINSTRPLMVNDMSMQVMHFSVYILCYSLFLKL